jgi:LysR family glycine cleavage system transcriptional activator
MTAPRASATLPPLSALRAFEAAGRLQSFTAAAHELRVTQSAISRQIRILEEHLRTRLFRRLVRAVALTESGAAYLRAITASFAQIEQATATVTAARQKRVLTVTCLPTLATSWMMPRLATFSAANPDLEVRLSTSIEPAAFGHDTLDFAVRVGPRARKTAERGAPRIDLTMTEQPSRVVFDYLFPDVLVPVCAPRLRHRGPRLSVPPDLRHHTLLHNATRPHAWPDFLRHLGVTSLVPRGEVSFGHFFMAMQAAIDGRGVALIPLILVLDAVRSRSLEIPLPAAVPSEGAYHLLQRRADRSRPEHRRFTRWILAEAQRSRQDCLRVLSGRLSQPGSRSSDAGRVSRPAPSRN